MQLRKCHECLDATRQLCDSRNLDYAVISYHVSFIRIRISIFFVIFGPFVSLAQSWRVRDMCFVAGTRNTHVGADSTPGP
jgi:hypothetical protein